MMKPRITLVGGGGYLGINIISKLQNSPEYAENYEICVVDYQLQQFRGVGVDYKKILFIKGSFLEVEILNDALQNTEVMFHIAAVGIMGVSGDDKNQIQKVNVYGTRFLLDKCREFGVKRFVYASSIAVSFVGEPFYNLTEDTPLPSEDKLLNYYSISKSRAETMVREASCVELKTCALRFRAIYGPGDPNATQRVVNMIKSGIFVCMATKHGRQALSHASSINNCSNSFLLADKMLRKEDGPSGKAYYILDKEIIGSYDFWGPLVDALGFERPTHYLPYCVFPILTTPELMLLAVDNTYSIKEAEKDMGYIPEEGMMDQVVEYYKHERITKNPHKNYICSLISGFVFTMFSILYFAI